VRFETIHPKELGPVEIGLWRAHQQTRPGAQSPYLTPDWAQIVGAARDDARVVTIGGGRGFFAAQRLSRFAAMGLGAPIADYQGVVAEHGVDVAPSLLCRALKVGRIDLTHVPEGATPLAAGGSDGSWIAETSGGRDLYEAGLKLRRGEFVRQADKKARKFARERGAPEFRAASPNADDFATLIGWKNEQLARTGQPQTWATPWVRAVLDQCFATHDTRFAGQLFTMHIETRLIGAAFGLRSGRVLHIWLIAHDAEFDTYSPGVQLARWLIGWAGDQGVVEVDFGPGDYQFKRQLSTAQRQLQRGVIAGASFSGAVRRVENAVRARIECAPHAALAALPGKAMRRIDLKRALAS
jgi:CelD/BcsL family acetyltransferase involved in cellulose biosynthesis